MMPIEGIINIFIWITFELASACLIYWVVLEYLPKIFKSKLWKVFVVIIAIVFCLSWVFASLLLMIKLDIGRFII